MNSPIISTIHIHTDPKFIDGTNFFEGPLFKNTVVIIGKKNGYKGFYKDKALYFKRSSKNVKKIINICSLADLVVLYDLDFVKSIIANRLPLNVILIWKFFGIELYERKKEIYQTELTRQICKLNFFGKRMVSIGKVVKLLKGDVDLSYYLLTKSFNSELEFNNALKRIDLFMGLSEQEYKHLLSIWHILPRFIQSPFGYWENIFSIKFLKKEEAVIIGNSKSPYNNHFEIIEMLGKGLDLKKIKFILPFSYGRENKYTKTLRKRLSLNSRYLLLEDFLDLKDYISLYSKTSAAIFNGYRQMAMGNILIALANGVKVYLNTKNVMFEWLKDLGFFIYNINRFRNDFKKNHLLLTNKEMLRNRYAYRRSIKRYSRRKLQEEIYKYFLRKNDIK